MTEATIKELWQYYCRKYLAKFGEFPRIRITSRDALILAILELENPYDEPDYDFD
jgi:hypothetical protein